MLKSIGRVSARISSLVPTARDAVDRMKAVGDESIDTLMNKPVAVCRSNGMRVLSTVLFTVSVNLAIGYLVSYGNA